MERRPHLQCSMQCLMILRFVIDNPCDMIEMPFARLRCHSALIAGNEDKHFVLRSLQRMGGGHVAHDRIIEAIPHKTEDVITQQPRDKSRRPTVDQIGLPKITVRENEAVKIVF